MTKLFIVAASIVLGSAAFAFTQGQINGDEAAGLVEQHQPQSGWALTEAGISENARPMRGTVIRIGGPVDFTDIYEIEMLICGSHSHSVTSCHRVGCLKIKEYFRTGRPVQAVINASAECK